jgi:hypothetical protein
MPRNSENPHRRQTGGPIIDYNGTGIWSVEGVQLRYRQYCVLHGVVGPRELSAKMYENSDRRWIYPIMDDVIAGIDDGNAACIALGLDFIEEDDLFAFGKLLKSNTARSLRRCGLLTEPQKERIRHRVVSMLIAGHAPHEMKQYIKLLRVAGVDAESWERLRQGIPRDNPYAMRFYNGLRMATGLPIER